MKLQDALRAVEPVVGFTSMVAALTGGDPQSINTMHYSETPTIEQVDAELDKVQELQNKTGSDAAYWGYEGQLSSLKAIRNILRAAEITGPDNLPDVPLPNRNGIVMAVYDAQEKFGKEVLRLANART